MSFRHRPQQLARRLVPRTVPDFVIDIEGMEPGSPVACTTTARYDPWANATTAREE